VDLLRDDDRERLADGDCCAELPNERDADDDAERVRDGNLLRVPATVRDASLVDDRDALIDVDGDADLGRDVTTRVRDGNAETDRDGDDDSERDADDDSDVDAERVLLGKTRTGDRDAEAEAESERDAVRVGGVSAVTCTGSTNVALMFSASCVRTRKLTLYVPTGTVSGTLSSDEMPTDALGFTGSTRVGEL
jgi:hypothetical protein